MVEIVDLEDIYQKLFEDIRKIEFLSVVKGKHAIGKRILLDIKKFGKPEYGKKVIKRLADDLGTNKRELWKCIQFAEKCDDIALLKGKSWYYITHEYLPESRREQIESLKEADVIVPEGLYKTIVIDPPWPYGREYDADTSRVANPYPEMSIMEIMDYPIHAHRDCILWLWTTCDFMDAAFDILAGWGFEARTILTWDKVKMGMGYWLRIQTEHCILATKGNVEWFAKDFRNIITEPRRQHSRKPDSFYLQVEKYCKLGVENKGLDIFAREKRNDKWDVKGNEVSKFELEQQATS